MKKASADIDKKALDVREEAEKRIKSLKEKASKNLGKAVNRIVEEVLGVKP